VEDGVADVFRCTWLRSLLAACSLPRRAYAEMRMVYETTSAALAEAAAVVETMRALAAGAGEVAASSAVAAVAVGSGAAGTATASPRSSLLSSACACHERRGGPAGVLDRGARLIRVQRWRWYSETARRGGEAG
jgi:hypothetical protein